MKWKRILVWGLLGAVAIAALGFFALYRMSWRFRHDVDVVRRIGLSDLSLAWGRGGEPVSFESGGLTIHGDLYRPAGDPPHPAILLVHGSSPWGRKLGLYPLLARELRQRGHVVLSIDVRGFGESDDPRALDSADAIDAVPDLLAGLERLAAEPSVDRERIFLVGHSMGAGLALRAAPRSPLVRKLVAIGPPRRTLARMGRELGDLRRRFSYDRRLEGQVPEALFDEVTRAWAIEALSGYYASDAHPPVLLIDGGLEDRPDLEFLRDYHAAMSPPADHRTIPGTGHYLSAVNFFGFPLTFYDRARIEEVASLIDDWLRAPGS